MLLLSVAAIQLICHSLSVVQYLVMFIQTQFDTIKSRPFKDMGDLT